MLAKGSVQDRAGKDWAVNTHARLHPFCTPFLGIGVKEARMEILGRMMPKDDSHGRENLEKAHDSGKRF